MMNDALKLFAKMFLVITVVFTAFMYILAIILGPALFYFTPEGLSTSTLHLSALPVWFLNIPVDIPIGLNIGILFMGLWTVFALSFVAAWKLKESFLKVIKESLVRPTGKLFSSSLFAMTIINSMSLIAIVAIQGIQEAGGIPTGTPPIPGKPFLDLVDLSHAAVFEEVGFRFIPIGSLLTVSLLITKKKEAAVSLGQKIKLSFVAFLLPDRAKKMAGAKTVSEHGILSGISLGEWGMLIFTSLVFGFAHFNPGVSWELGKVTSAGVAGFVIGLSYLVYGAHASILMHWFFNVYADTFFLLSETVPALAPFANAVAIISIILGILGWTVLVALGSVKLARKIRDKGKQPEIDYGSPEAIS